MSDKTKNIVITITFILFILIILVINILKKDIDISISERRKLAKFPEISIEKIIEGTSIKQFENYTMDQFILRDKFRSLKAYIELKLFNKKDNNDIYVYNDSFIKKEYPLNEKSVLNTVEKIKYIKEKYLEDCNIYYSIIPDKNYYPNEKEYIKLDYNKLEKIMNDNLQDLKYINIFDCLNLENYYYTDTHWKQENLDKVLDNISNDMNFKDRLKTNFEIKFITDFKGVYSGQLPIKSKQDNISILTNKIIEEAKVYNYETNKETKIYDIKKINSNDKYDIYLSGATPLLTITNKNSNTNKELIVFRDSFASSLIPLFTEAYSKITVVDTRYIRSKDLDNYIEFKNQEVLFIYSTLIINNSEILK